MFNASGAGKEIDRHFPHWDRTKEGTGCLSTDGSTRITELLWYSLSCSSMSKDYPREVFVIYGSLHVS